MEDLYQGAVPSRLILAMVKSQAYSGSYKHNPFNFIHAECSSVGVFLNDESVPAQPLRLNFDNDNYMSGYYSLFTTLNKDGQDTGNNIDRDDYPQGYTLFAFEVLPSTSTDSGSLEQFPLIRRGNLKVQLTFKEQTEEHVTLLAVGKFPDMLQIDSSRNVML